MIRMALDYIGDRNTSGALCLILGAGTLLIVAIRYWGR
jgi:hypothetical protein